MSLQSLLRRRVETEGPVGVGVIGAEGAAPLAATDAYHVVGVATPDPVDARAVLLQAGWQREAITANSLDHAVRLGTTCLLDDTRALVSHPGIEVVVECSTDPAVAAGNAAHAIDAGRHVVMANAGADALLGPLLAERAREAGVVYTTDYSGRSGQLCALVEWCRLVGLDVVSAGFGVEQQSARSDPDPARTRAAIELAIVANVAGLEPQHGGLQFPPAGVDTLPMVCRPREFGGSLAKVPTVEAVVSVDRDGTRLARPLAGQVFVTVESGSGRPDLADGGLATDDTGRYAALLRPPLPPGFGLRVSIASAVVRHEATGCASRHVADVGAVAARALAPGHVLDGGSDIEGRLMPATDSVRRRALPHGLAAGATLVRHLEPGEVVSWEDVVLVDELLAVRLRRRLDQRFQLIATSGP